jgi:hypothetical protein
MSMLATISLELEAWSKPRLVGDRLLVPTFSFYPSNAMVQIFVEGGNDSFVVSDGGGAIETLHGAGGHKVAALKMLPALVRGHEFKVSGSGWIYGPNISRSEITGAISLISETSVRCSEILLRHFKPEMHSDFRKDIEVALEHRYRDAFKAGGHLPGASNKIHKFDYVVRTDHGNTIVMDAVVPDSSSINAALVSHLDLMRTNRPDIKQAIIYDDGQKWKSADLALLTLAAPPIAYSHFEGQLERLAA